MSNRSPHITHEQMDYDKIKLLYTKYSLSQNFQDQRRKLQQSQTQHIYTCI